MPTSSVAEEASEPASESCRRFTAYGGAGPPKITCHAFFSLLDHGLLIQFWSFAEFHPVLSKFKGKVHWKIDAQCPPPFFLRGAILSSEE